MSKSTEDEIESIPPWWSQIDPLELIYGAIDWQYGQAPRKAIELSSTSDETRQHNREQMERLKSDPNHIPVFLDDSQVEWETQDPASHYKIMAAMSPTPSTPSEPPTSKSSDDPYSGMDKVTEGALDALEDAAESEIDLEEDSPLLNFYDPRGHPEEPTPTDERGVDETKVDPQEVKRGAVGGYVDVEPDATFLEVAKARYVEQITDEVAMENEIEQALLLDDGEEPTDEAVAQCLKATLHRAQNEGSGHDTNAGTGIDNDAANEKLDRLLDSSDPGHAGMRDGGYATKTIQK